MEREENEDMNGDGIRTGMGGEHEREGKGTHT